jgi:hypothetical protein
MFKDYPEYVDVLQKALDDVVAKPSKVTPPFELAVWMLEDALSALIAKARKELHEAEAAGDAEAIARADQKLKLMFGARSGGKGMLDLSELSEYFEAHKEVFQ